MGLNLGDKKAGVIMVLVLVLFMGAYQMFKERQDTNASGRYAEYLALRSKPLDADGKRQMELFVQKLAVILAKIEPLPVLEAGDQLPRGPYAKGFELHLCDLYLLRQIAGHSQADTLQAALKTSGLLEKLPSYLGNADFPYDLKRGKWHQGTLAEAKNLEQDRYLLIFCPVEYDPPQAYEGNGNFKGGLLRGRVYLADLSSQDLIASLDLRVQNQGTVKVGKYKTAAAQEKDLLQDLEKSLLGGMSLVSDSLLGLPLPEYGRQIRGLQ